MMPVSGVLSGSPGAEWVWHLFGFVKEGRGAHAQSDWLRQRFLSEEQGQVRPLLCAAIVDRLTFAGQIVETGSTSYRLVHARNARPAS
jgi:hypothetical protein